MTAADRDDSDDLLVFGDGGVNDLNEVESARLEEAFNSADAYTPTRTQSHFV